MTKVISPKIKLILKSQISLRHKKTLKMSVVEKDSKKAVTKVNL